MSTINIIGHKSPDMDSVVSAVSYAYLKNKIDPTNTYVANRAGEVNAETKYIFSKFGVNLPELLTDATGKKIILVDHNETEQVVDNIAQGELVEIIDHHKVKFAYDKPIFIHMEPIGSTATIVNKMFNCREVEMPKEIAGILLGGMLIDTVITKSSTCTSVDVKAIEELSAKVGVDYKEFGLELFKVRSSVSSLAPKEIISSDHKDFDINGKKFNIGQVETVDLKEFDNLKAGILGAMKEKKEQGGYHSLVFFVTDILQEGSQFFVLSDELEKFEKAFECKLENNQCYLTGVMSRKKQVVPVLMKNF